jgi:hypothetical protein
MSITYEYIRDLFIGSITEETGGEVCYKSMTLQYKIAVNIIFVNLYTD